MTALIELLARAQRAGLTLTCGDDDTLRIRGPHSAEPIARKLL